MSENVRQVLSYVIRGEADAGMVYATDAQEAGNQVRVALRAAESTHQAIVYPAVIVKAGHQDLARQFLDFLHTDKAQRALTDRGFTVPAQQPTTQP